MTGKTESFATLFRQSAFARWNPKIPQVYTRPNSISQADKDLTFGMKRDFADNHFGCRLQNVTVTNMDSRYGFPEYSNAAGSANRALAWQEITYKTEVLPSTSSGNGSEQKRPLVVGRLLGSAPGGYSIGLAGLVAFLPSGEIPAGRYFSPRDFLERRTFEFLIKQVTRRSPDGAPIVILTLKL